MVKFYSGTPGSGKSYHMAQEIYRTLRRRKNVIATVSIDLNEVSKRGRKQIGEFIYMPMQDLTPEFLYKYAVKNHEKGIEGQTLLVIDECQIIFDSRTFQAKERREWVLFFSRHRHLGYEVTLISQKDHMIDRQIRGMFEYEYRHRKVNNYWFLWMLPFTVFVVTQYLYGNRHLKMDRQFVLYRKSVARIYDSYTMYDDFFDEYSKEAQGCEISEDVPRTEQPIAQPAKPQKGIFAAIRRFFLGDIQRAPLKTHQSKRLQGSDAQSALKK
ncbi:MAG: zonular occludens toxin domain-containing protein [Defluviitaleaceae bacterium]|nr:zonular occludens toxin domain-containing protein [Defluviitaleaceae bacterium]